MLIKGLMRLLGSDSIGWTFFNTLCCFFLYSFSKLSYHFKVKYKNFKLNHKLSLSSESSLYELLKLLSLIDESTTNTLLFAFLKGFSSLIYIFSYVRAYSLSSYGKAISSRKSIYSKFSFILSSKSNT